MHAGSDSDVRRVFNMIQILWGWTQLRQLIRLRLDRPLEIIELSDEDVACIRMASERVVF